MLVIFTVLLQVRTAMSINNNKKMTKNTKKVYRLVMLLTVFPGLIKTAKFVVWSYSQVAATSVFFTSLDPTVDQAPFGVVL